ncbi:hypothetical protein PC116_g23830 [Phytophthora cactorum]|uniref:ZSWIM1/3 RNaseH-like domain-containing protein n=2 Tax=Phytophthora cactorum TaxID=29920 RepID=A0A8T1JVY2_9STRA|nr:hypothetical protein PC118_g19237 [Phytophthora cactorum]KAG4227796.1 hypothetical protein PC116_g23830 [Phytophthora cactorum]
MIRREKLRASRISPLPEIPARDYARGDFRRSRGWCLVAAGGAKRKKILRYLKESSGKPILLNDVLEDFSEGPGNVASVFRDVETMLTSCNTFQTSHTRRMARLFPEVICVDATHGTNINRYRLFSFMVTDKFGSGAFAQNSLVDGETRANEDCNLTVQTEQ